MLLSESYKTRLLELAGVPGGISMNEISPGQIDIPEKYIQDNLDEKIWQDGKLNEIVRKRLLKIAKEFYKFLKIDTTVKDIAFTGSMANYNWTKFSDIDLHLMINYNDIKADPKFTKEYLTAKKSIWNEKHNIKIAGHDVELYAQDVEEPHHSTGIFSIVNNKWIIKPEKQDFKIDKKSVKNKAYHLINAIEKVDNEKDPDKSYILGTNLKDKIKQMRKSGLEETGEFSVENLAFKYLRNGDYLKTLFDITRDAYNKSLSLTGAEVLAEEVYENVKHIHRNKEEIDDGGFLGDIINKYPIYQPSGVMMSMVDLDEWETSQDMVNEFIEMYKSNKDYPPIIFDPETNSVIDGMHRVKALNELGVKEVKAYIGKRK